MLTRLEPSPPLWGPQISTQRICLTSEYICIDEATPVILTWTTPIVIEAVVADRELLVLWNIFSRVEDYGIDDESLHGAAWGHQVSQRPLFLLRLLNRVLHLTQFVLHVVFSTSEPLQGLLSDILPTKYMSVFRIWLTITQTICRASVYSAQSRQMPFVRASTERASFCKLRQTVSEYVMGALEKN